MNKVQRIKQLIAEHPRLFRIFCWSINHFPFRNHVHIRKGNSLLCNESILTHCRISVEGIGNRVYIGHATRLRNTSIVVYGCNSTVWIDDWCNVVDGDIYIENSNSKIVIGRHTNICGKTHLACIEGRDIYIGEDCLFSSDVTIRVGDSHSILDESGKRINPSHHVEIGNHVWICNKTIVLKGAKIPSHSIIASGAVVSGRFEEKGVILGGVPARVIKKGIDWCQERIEVKSEMEG